MSSPITLKKSLLALAVSQALLVGSTEAATITVTSTDDTTVDDAVCTLREAIISANNDDNSAEDDCAAGSGDDTIVFDNSLSGSTVTLASNLTRITENTAIDGDIDGDNTPDITIDGDDSYTAISSRNVSGKTIDLNGLTITNTRNSGSGSAVYIDANSLSTLTLSNSVITANNCGGRGCGVFGAITNVTIDNSTISENTSSGSFINGGSGAGIRVSRGDLTVNNSTISGNRGTRGAGIHVFHSANGNHITINNSTITNNYSSDTVGGAYLGANNVTVTNSTISGNSAASTTAYSGAVGGNAPFAQGLHVYQPSNATISNTVIAGNSLDCTREGSTPITQVNNLIEDGGTGDGTYATSYYCGTPALSGDPNLGALADNGGDTYTLAPAYTSSVIDAGDNTNCGIGLATDTDQRGLARDDGNCDIGAVEYRPRFSWDNENYSVNEGDGTITLTVNFTGSNDATTVDYATSDNTATSGDDYTAVTNTLSFAAGVTSQSITLNIAEDSIFEGDEDFSVTLSNPAYSSSGTHSLDIDETSAATVTIEENDLIAVSSSNLSTGESGTDSSFTVVLNRAPTSNVDITLTNNDTTEGLLDVSSLTFTTSDWNMPQTVTVTGVDDDVVDGDITYLINLDASSADGDYSGLSGPDVSVTNMDEGETVGISVNKGTLLTAEDGTSDSFTVVLDSEPTNDVTITLTNGDSTEGSLSTSSLTFDSGNWSIPQTVTVTGVDDDIVDGDITYLINLDASSADSNYSGLSGPDVSATNEDEGETVGISVNKSTLLTSEDGTSDSFTMVLDSEPTNDVTITLTNGDSSEGTLNTSSLTFNSGNWSTPQTVTATGVDDAIDDGDQAYSVSFGVSSSDANYNGFSIANVTVLNNDNESSGISLSKSTLVTSEDGTSDSFMVVLDSQPTSDVTITLTNGDSTEGTLSASSLTFTSSNWSTAQTVTATGVDDAIADGDQAYSVSFSVSSSDANFNGQSISDVTVLNTDNESSGITLSQSTLVTSEDGTSDSFTVVLDSQPTNDVTITLTNGDNTEGTLNTSSLTFNSSNWSTAQTVTATGVDDAIEDGDQAYSISFSVSSSDNNFNGLSIADVTVLNNDNESSGISLNKNTLVTSEDGTSDSFSVVLDSEPTSDVTITLTNGDNTEGTLSTSSLTFNSSNWNAAQTVTATGVDDTIEDGDQAYSISFSVSSSDANFNGQSISDVTVLNTDNESSGITLSQSTLVTSEDGTSDSFTVVLNSEPTNDVTITLTNGDNTEGTLSTSILTFNSSNWSTAQTVTATGVDDAIADGDQAYNISFSVSSSDANFNGQSISDVTVLNTDNESSGITLSQSTLVTSEDGTSDSFTLVLNSEPTNDVTITLINGDSTEGTLSTSSLTFNSSNWSTAQTVTATGVDDAITDGDQAYSVSFSVSSSDNNFNGLSIADVTVLNTDNESSGISLSKNTLVTSEDGTSDSFTVVLDSEPTNDVTITLTNGDNTEGTLSTSSLTFNSSNWNTPQTVTATGVDDAIEDGDQAYSISFSVSSSDVNFNGLSVADVTVLNNDNESSGITLSQSTLVTSEDGTSDSFTVVLDSEPTNDVTVTLTNGDNTEGTLNTSSLTFTSSNWSTPQTVTATGVDDNIDDGDQAYNIALIVSSMDSLFDGLSVSDVKVLNLDNETSGIEVSKNTLLTSEDGTSDSFSMVLSSAPTADVTINLTNTDATEGILSTSSLTFTSSNWSTAQTVAVTGVDDSINDGDQAYSINFSVSSIDSQFNNLPLAGVTVLNTDNENSEIRISKNTLVTSEGGNQDQFSVTLNSEPTAEVTITLTNDDPSEGALSVSSMTFDANNWQTAQTITVSGVDDNLNDGDIAYNISFGVSSLDTNFDGQLLSNVTVINLDNESSNNNNGSDKTIEVSKTLLSTNEDATSDSFEIVLSSAPTDEVIITLTNNDRTEGTLSTTSLTFSPDNWSTAQTVMVTGVDDIPVDGDIAYSISITASSDDADYNGLPISSVTVINNDNDFASSSGGGSLNLWLLMIAALAAARRRLVIK
ncbi:beta strand repeat-containing protein [Aliikangiella coralliicola]|uniref:CSLREA domain-containing protein n=1 Tax=Aliikangiella coralliicola TaxID=2592383 RepID=A0A545UF22_9GAMM|nr:Calx-beta domain-containing protein [Aliikangiella coralliicola]TQV88064.1 CSLREA domain-containing protein [Aliikangiella coralliicola]